MDPTGDYVEYGFVAEFYDYVVPYRDRQDVAFFVEMARRHRTVSRDLFNQVTDNELIYYVTHPDGREERLVHRFQMRYLFRFEADHLLARSGLQVEKVYSDYDKSPYGAKYPGDLIIVASKV
jgi:hypothetical protein